MFTRTVVATRFTFQDLMLSLRDTISFIRYNVYILKDPKNNRISSPQYGYRYLIKGKIGVI